MTARGTVALLVLMMPLAAIAQEAGDPAAGGQIAANWCANCHVVGAKETVGTSTGAPSFPSIAAQKSLTPMALSAFLQTPHARMPDLHLSREEIADVAAYIQSLRSQ